MQTQGHLVEQVAFMPAGGWAIASNDPMPSTGDPLRTFETEYFQESPGAPWQSIYDRLAVHGVPGVSVAFVQDNEVAWRTSYGVLEAGGSDYVYASTPFQVGSVSKAISAIGVTALWPDTSVLSTPLSEHTTWAIPVAPGVLPSSAGTKATVEQALQHRAGFNVPSFAGYRNDPNQPLPMLDQILAGANPPANSPPIEIAFTPGDYQYSGGGYVVLMRMLEDVTGTDFGQWMGAHLLGPLEMTESTFAIDLPAELSRAAIGHTAPGQPIADGHNRYPESSAAGLYSTAGDLCRALAMLNNLGTLGSATVLTAKQAQAVVENSYGFNASGTYGTPDFTYIKAGNNLGFVAHTQGYPHQRAALAFIVNLNDGNDGPAFYEEGIAALTRIYGL
jgi:CubicO group peptidase (beta-lactamase class C family)